MPHEGLRWNSFTKDRYHLLEKKVGGKVGWLGAAIQDTLENSLQDCHELVQARLFLGTFTFDFSVAFQRAWLPLG